MGTIKEENNCVCGQCGSSFNKMFLLGKQGNAETCPMCGGELKTEEDNSDWITWYYYGYKSDNGKTTLLDDSPIDLTQHGDTFFLIKEFKAPPETAPGGLEEVKRILRTYIPDAFVYQKKEEPKVRCPRCGSAKVELMPKKFSLITGFATNQYDRVCVYCKKRF
ncbi:MAG: hypothetical protein IJA10_12665 [Lachnospiraceae bacterium]|nr:hypothetical protein [Lachnospiraceae bacterium]